MAKEKRFVMRVLAFTLFCFFNAFSQNKSIDTAAVSFKAKLFTVSEYGISDREKILSDIENQELTFLETKYKNFTFMKVSFSQPYRLPNNRTQMLYRNCDYYIAFHTNFNKFYKLGGFDSLDIDSFFEDLIQSEGNIFKDVIHRQEIQDIDIYCLYDYYKMKQSKRIKKGFACLDNCAQKTTTTIILHSDGSN